MAETTHICPPGSEPQLAATYKPRGSESKLDDLPIYSFGSSTTAAIIVFYDIFGFDAGRIRLICDQLADAGFFVVMPDFFRGNGWSESRTDDRSEWLKGITPNHMKSDIEKVVKYINDKGIQKIGGIGFCWGAFTNILAAGTGKLSAGANIHPSLGLGPRIFNISEESQVEAVTCPQLWIPCGNDPANVKPGGEVQKILDKKPFGPQCEYHSLEDMTHGFVPRGDISKPEIASNVKFVMETSIKFFQKNLH